MKTRITTKMIITLSICLFTIFTTVITDALRRLNNIRVANRLGPQKKNTRQTRTPAPRKEDEGAQPH